MSQPLAAAKRVVVKIGSSTLADAATGQIRQKWFSAFAEDVASLAGQGREVILVSSGAIALGRHALGLGPGTLRLEESQAAAAVGQIALARAWSERLGQHKLTVAQVLLTLDDTEDRRRYLNARATLKTLLSLKALPVINENDTVATAEIRFGDNDRLAARVAVMMEADCLILLSDIDGLHAEDPRINPAAPVLSRIDAITPEIEAMAGGAGSAAGSGGMVTKVMAARMAMDAGCHMIIASGAPLHPLSRLTEGSQGTWFVASSTPQAARKRWIGGAVKPLGRLEIDLGAERALGQGASLLPAGVLRVDGRFERGDCVSVYSQGGRELARGLVAYSAEDARSIARRKSAEIEGLLGYRGRDEMIHRDDLVLMARQT